MTTQVHKITLLVVDHDHLGIAGVANALENERFPNRCIVPQVMGAETVEIDYTDKHPLNNHRTRYEEFRRLFPVPTAPSAPSGPMPNQRTFYPPQPHADELDGRATVISLLEATAIAKRSAAHHKNDPDSTAWPPMWVIDAVLAGSRAGHVAGRIQQQDDQELRVETIRLARLGPAADVLSEVNDRQLARIAELETELAKERERTAAHEQRPDAPPSPTLTDALIQLGMISQRLRSDGIVTAADDLSRVAADIQRAAIHISWLTPPGAACERCQGCGATADPDMLDVTMRCTECREFRGLPPIPAVLRARDTAIRHRGDAAIRRLRDSAIEGTATDAITRHRCSVALGERGELTRDPTFSEVMDAREAVLREISRLRSAEPAAQSVTSTPSTPRAVLAPNVIEACARAGWYAQVAFDGGIDGASSSREGFSWAFVQHAAKEKFRDSAARVLNGTKQHFETPGVRLFHEVVWATATALLGTCPGAVTGVHAPGCAALRPPAPASDQELETRKATVMSIPTHPSAFKTTVFRILMLDGKRSGEFRLVCGVGGCRVERCYKTDLNELTWIGSDMVGMNEQDPAMLLGEGFVISMMNRLIALRAARGEALVLSTSNESITEIDLGTIDLAPAPR